MNSFTLKQQLITMISQQYPELNALKIEHAIEQIDQFASTRPNILGKREEVEQLVRVCGLKKCLMKDSLSNKTSIVQAVERYILLTYFKANSLNFKTEICKTLKLEHAIGNIEVTTSDPNISLSAGPISSNLTSSRTKEKNHRIFPTLDIQVITEDSRVDEYIQNSLFLNHYFTIFETCNKLQKLQLKFLVDSLMARAPAITRIVNSAVNTKFRINNQSVMSDYISNLTYNNDKIYKQLLNFKIIPYCLELNGIPGVGKSTFVDALSKVLLEIFPFLNSDNAVYNRVNDKFWNGYHGQPIVLYDDSNQNDKMLYNLDNEIIAIGSGQFVHPPMAFEKDTKFASIFVCFTTNKPIIETTKAEKGAISRRLHTVSVVPKSNLGTLVSDIYGQKFVYHPGVKQDVFNLQFDGNSVLYVLNSFLEKVCSPFEVKETENPFSVDFMDYVPPKVKTVADEIFDFIGAFNTKDVWTENMERHLHKTIPVAPLVEPQCVPALPLTPEEELMNHLGEQIRVLDQQIQELDERTVVDTVPQYLYAKEERESSKGKYHSEIKYTMLYANLAEYFDKMMDGQCLRLNRDPMVYGRNLYAYRSEDFISLQMFGGDGSPNACVIYYKDAWLNKLYSTCIYRMNEEAINIMNEFLNKRLIPKSKLQEKRAILQRDLDRTLSKYAA